jgi:hypothetical protein
VLLPGSFPLLNLVCGTMLPGRNILRLFAVLTILSAVCCRINAIELDFTSANGEIYVDGVPFYIKGVNWFGSG